MFFIIKKKLTPFPVTLLISEGIAIKNIKKNIKAVFFINVKYNSKLYNNSLI